MNAYPVVQIAIVVTLKDTATFVWEILYNIIYQQMEEILQKIILKIIDIVSNMLLFQNNIIQNQILISIYTILIQIELILDVHYVIKIKIITNVINNVNQNQIIIIVDLQFFQILLQNNRVELA
ncbi:unnamed protein product [Paramecium pentaurelia]|uniref:Uncharacterized protein n=1 Tax=Paramecium pentaurelia TaxID=43138 RepID=A0A8S1UCR5_9CILI|nr:unnamed protein product [Paramecium pentaurelia]